MLYASALGQLVFMAQLIIAGFLIRMVQLRNPEGQFSKALALLF